MSKNAPKLDLKLAHRYFAANCFNETWTFIEKPDRSEADNEQMLFTALASYWHWTQRDDITDKNHSIGRWQLARVYALVGDSDEAKKHGEKSLAYAEGTSPFFIAYGHEAIARAAIVGGDKETAKHHLAEARKLCEAITDAEDMKLIEPDLAELESQV